MANTSRMNRLEELGRVDAEKAHTSKGKRNLREEKKRIVRELKARGGQISRQGSANYKSDRRPSQQKVRKAVRELTPGHQAIKAATKLIKGLPKLAKKGWK